MKYTFIKLVSISLLASLSGICYVQAQTESAATTAPVVKHVFETGPHGGLVCPSNDNYKFEMVYSENDKKVEIYFLSPDNQVVESGTLTGDLTFIDAQNNVSKINAVYSNKKFTSGVPDGKPLYMCGLVLTWKGQVYGGKFINPSLSK